MIKTALAYPPSKHKGKKKKKNPPFSPYHGVRFQFVQRCEHVNVILSGRNVRKSRHYAILDAQRIFNGRVKNIHWVHVVVHSVQFFISQDVDMHAGYVYHSCVFGYVHPRVQYVCKRWISNSAQPILASANVIGQHYSSDNRRLRLNVCIENY